MNQATQPSAVFRLYEELNEHLPPGRRKRAFEYPFADGTTVGAALTQMGVPTETVDLILADGIPAGLDHPLRPGERIAVYPVFEAFDIAPASALARAPLRRPRFICGPDLHPLAERLRERGFDCRRLETNRPSELVEAGTAEARILLTRDRRAAADPRVTRMLRVHANGSEAQLREVLERLQLDAASGRP